MVYRLCRSRWVRQKDPAAAPRAATPFVRCASPVVLLGGRSLHADALEGVPTPHLCAGRGL